MKKYLITGISLLAVLSINIYLRSLPAYFPQLKSEAKNTVDDKIRDKVRENTNKKFPDFGFLARKKVFVRELAEYKNKNRLSIKKDIRDEYLKLKGKYQDEKGQTYLSELDCWHWARYTENVVRLGRVGDKVVNGKEVDAMMLAPVGAAPSWASFLFYLSASLYKAYAFIWEAVPLYNFLFYLPLFYCAVFIIVLYLICRRLRGNIAAIIACLFVGLSPSLISRSSAGWFDTDIFNLFFPLVICWFYAGSYGVEVINKKLAFNQNPQPVSRVYGKVFYAFPYQNKAIWLCFAAMWMGLFCWTWLNWWFILGIIVIYEAYSLLKISLSHYDDPRKAVDLSRQHVFSLKVFLFSGAFWIILFCGWEPFKYVYIQVKESLFLNSPLRVSVWPNVYSTVAELKAVNPFMLFSRPLFTISFGCMAMLFLRALRKGKVDSDYEFITLLVVWFMVMFFACFKGIRFIMFLSIPLGVSLGWVISEACEYFNKKAKLLSLAVIVLAAFLIVDVVAKGYDSMIGAFPLMDNTWHKALTAIKEKTPKSAIINSWWDYGDWFKAVAARPVIFDGQSQNTPQAYWMAHVLVSADEKEAVAVLRMLNNGGNRAFEIINKSIKDPFASILFLKKIMLFEPQKAREGLLKFFPQKDTEELMRLLFGKAPSAYFVVDYTMPDKIIPISFLGNWDFAKVYLSQNFSPEVKKKVEEYFLATGTDKKVLDKFFEEARLIGKGNFDRLVSHKSKFYSQLIEGKVKGDMALFDNAMVYKIKDKKIYLYSSQDFKYQIPKSLFYIEQDKIQEVVFPDNDVNYSVLVFDTPEGISAVLLDRELANSMFVRLYYLNGKGLKNFKPALEEKDGDKYIRTFEIVWE